jgi:hypothetical protein
MAITLTYRSTRDELLRWYGRLWLSRLWKYHLVIFVVVFLADLFISGFPRIGNNTSFIIRALLASFAVIAILVIYPQIMYKPNMRTLTVNDQGINTNIGARSGEISWLEIISIEEANKCICISSQTGNAFLVPDRAFKSVADRSYFLDEVRKWYQRAKEDKLKTNVSSSSE